jgi:hypothetical protein
MSTINRPGGFSVIGGIRSIRRIDSGTTATSALLSRVAPKLLNKLSFSWSGPDENRPLDETLCSNGAATRVNLLKTLEEL